MDVSFKREGGGGRKDLQSCQMTQKLSIRGIYVRDRGWPPEFQHRLGGGSERGKRPTKGEGLMETR